MVRSSQNAKQKAFEAALRGIERQHRNAEIEGVGSLPGLIVEDADQPSALAAEAADVG